MGKQKHQNDNGRVSRHKGSCTIVNKGQGHAEVKVTILIEYRTVCESKQVLFCFVQLNK